MTPEEIINEILERYSKRAEVSAVDSGIARERGTIFVKKNEEEYTTAFRTLADKAGEELADAIWKWIPH